MIIQEHVPLAPLTTLGVGGTARFFVVAETIDDITEALAFARENALPVFVLGGGSNIVIADSGFDGLVVSMRMQGITSEKKEGDTLITVGSGVIWDEFVVWTIAQNLKGLECMSGVPGTVGGAVVANLGAYGAQVSDTFLYAEVIDTQDTSNALKVVKKEACNFSYHDSMFGQAKGRYVVLRARFKLNGSGTSRFSYQGNRFDLSALATALGHEPTQEEIRTAILNMRREKGMLADSYQSAGSFFHLPFVSAEKYAETLAKACELDAVKERHLRPWAWKQPDGSYKIASGFLFECSEFQRGYVRGRVGISPKHTLAIINLGSASARDVSELARDMQNAVKKIFGIDLEREVEYIGAVEK